MSTARVLAFSPCVVRRIVSTGTAFTRVKVRRERVSWLLREREGGWDGSGQPGPPFELKNGHHPSTLYII